MHSHPLMHWQNVGRALFQLFLLLANHIPDKGSFPASTPGAFIRRNTVFKVHIWPGTLGKVWNYKMLIPGFEKVCHFQKLGAKLEKVWKFITNSDCWAKFQKMGWKITKIGLEMVYGIFWPKMAMKPVKYRTCLHSRQFFKLWRLYYHTVNAVKNTGLINAPSPVL